MVITLAALFILICSSLLVLGNLRDITRDTVEALTASASSLRAAGLLMQRVSFFTLWAMIFVLSFY